MNFATGVNETQSPGGIDRNRVFQVVDPGEALSVVERGDDSVHVVCERLISYTRNAIPDELDRRPLVEELSEDYGVEEGERRALGMADCRDRWADVYVLNEECRDRVVYVEEGAVKLCGNVLVDSGCRR